MHSMVSVPNSDGFQAFQHNSQGSASTFPDALHALYSSQAGPPFPLPFPYQTVGKPTPRKQKKKRGKKQKMQNLTGG